MSESFDSAKSPAVRFSWGGAIATFFTDDGIHVFGKGSSRMLLKERLLLAGPGTVLIVITLLLLVFYFPKTPFYIFEAIFFAELFGIIGLGILQTRKNLKKAYATFAKDPNLQDLLVSEQAHQYYSWSDIKQVRFTKFRNRRVLYIYPQRPRFSGRTYYYIGFPDIEKASQVNIFLREKLGDKKVKGVP